MHKRRTAAELVHIHSSAPSLIVLVVARSRKKKHAIYPGKKRVYYADMATRAVLQQKEDPCVCMCVTDDRLRLSFPIAKYITGDKRQIEKLGEGAVAKIADFLFYFSTRLK